MSFHTPAHLSVQQTWLALCWVPRSQEKIANSCKVDSVELEVSKTIELSEEEPHLTI